MSDSESPFDETDAAKWLPLFRQVWHVWENAMTKRCRMEGFLVFGMVKPAAEPTAAGCRELGLALSHWALASEPACAYAIEPLGHSDLFDSERPKPWSIRLAQLSRGAWGDLLAPLRDFCAANAGRRVSVDELAAMVLKAACHASPDGLGDHRYVQIAAIGEPQFTREEIVGSLLAAIPGKLVDDVLIHGRSWSEQ